MIPDKQIRKRMIKAGIGKRYLEADITDFPKGLRKVADHSFFISGEVGCGKTHLLAAIVKQYISRSIKHDGRFFCPRFISVSDFLYKLKSTFTHESKENEYDFIKEVINEPVLCLDDLGTTKISDWSL